MKKLLLLSIMSIFLLSGCTEVNNDQNNYQTTSSTIPLEFQLGQFSWVPWLAQSDLTICQSLNLNPDNPYKTTISAPISCNKYTKCSAKIDGIDTSTKDIVCHENTDYIEIGILVTHEGETFRGVDVTKDHTILVCCEGICETRRISKLC